MLTRGPVHEAFAEPVTFNPKPGFIAPKQPPEAIEELPPEQKPEGDDVEWISGYWSWDDERRDFIWVSGIYRVVPPNRQWVPGYWNRVAAGHQWVPGMWASAKDDVEYYPAPPDSLEVGPSSEAPTVDHTWVPGYWTWRETRYLWRPGHWTPAHEGWIWVPAHYVWTPHGYAFVPGYWDAPIERRGLLFAPVYFDPVIIVRPAFCYRPRVVIGAHVLTTHLFCRPAYHHYCFGDYYAASYVSIGILPWFSFHIGHHGHCPIYAHHHWHHAHHHHGVDLHISLRRDYEHRRDHIGARPPRTFVAQQTVINNINIQNNNIQNNTVINRNSNNRTINRNVDARQMTLAQPLSEVAQSRETSLRLERVNDQQQEQLRNRAREVRRFQEERGRLEASTNHDSPRARNAGPSRLELRSPVAARSTTDGGARQSDGGQQGDGNRRGDGKRQRDTSRIGDGSRQGDTNGSGDAHRPNKVNRSIDGNRSGDAKRPGDGKRSDAKRPDGGARKNDIEPRSDGRGGPRSDGPRSGGPKQSKQPDQGDRAGSNDAAGQGPTGSRQFVPPRTERPGRPQSQGGSDDNKQPREGRGKGGDNADGPSRGGPRQAPRAESGQGLPRAKQNVVTPPANTLSPPATNNAPIPRPKPQPTAPNGNFKLPQSGPAAPKPRPQTAPAQVTPPRPPAKKEQAQRREQPRPSFGGGERPKPSVGGGGNRPTPSFGGGASPTQTRRPGPGGNGPARKR